MHEKKCISFVCIRKIVSLQQESIITHHFRPQRYESPTGRDETPVDQSESQDDSTLSARYDRLECTFDKHFGCARCGQDYIALTAYPRDERCGAFAIRICR